MESGDLPTPEPESVEHWHRIACNWFRRFLPRRFRLAKRKSDSRVPTRRNVYNFNGVFYGDVSIYEEGDKEPRVVIQGKKAPSSGADDEPRDPE